MSEHIAIISGPDVSFHPNREGNLLSAPWFQTHDITGVHLERLPARWQKEFVARWHQYKPGGGEAVLTRCRELVAAELAQTPDDPKYASYRKHAWLCGLLPATAVPTDLLNYQAWANHHRPSLWEKSKKGLLTLLGFYFPPTPTF